MGFLCPKCLDYSLNIVEKLELPPDSLSDEITLQIIKCEKCSFEGVAVYEEARRGNLNDYTLNHTGYVLSCMALNKTKTAIKNNAKYFEVYDENHRWVWISSQPFTELFPIKMQKNL